MANYERLGSLERELAQFCSVIYEPVDLVFMTQAIRTWSEAPPELKGLAKTSLNRYLSRLRSTGMLDANLRCEQAVVEVLTRQAVARGRFQGMAKAVEMTPAPKGRGRSFQLLCLRAKRNLRIALYRQDLKAIHSALENVHVFCGKGGKGPIPLVAICNNPFDRSWFQTLPLELQIYVLGQTIGDAIYHFRSDHEALKYALEPSFLRSIDLADNPGFHDFLVLRLLLGGRLEDAGELLSVPTGGEHGQYLTASLNFLRGDDGVAAASFEQALAALRRRIHRRNGYFPGIPGVFYVLALLRLGGFEALAKADQIVAASHTAKYVEQPLLPVYRSLHAMVHSFLYRNDAARSLLGSEDSSHKNAVAHFFHVLAGYCLDNALPQEEVDSLSQLFIRARDAGLDWFALELAELLCRVEQETPVRRRFIDHVRNHSGLESFVACRRVEEKWRRDLQALALCATGAPLPGDQIGSRRLAWFLEYRDRLVSLTPKEQKLNARGVWTRGRKVSWKRLHDGTNLDFMGPHDQRLRAAVNPAGGFYRNYYELNLDLALPALVGHPWVFLVESPGVQVEVVRGEPEVLVKRIGPRINVGLAWPMPDGRPVLVRETPTRFKVIELSAAQKKIIQVLGRSGLNAPASAQNEVLSVVSSIASLVTVHSAVDGLVSELEQAEAEATPHLHLLPAGSGLTAEMFVKPLGEGGPCLKPGQGAETVIAEIDGRRRQTRRDLDLEQRLARAVESGCPVLLQGPETDRQWTIEEPNDCLQLLLDLKGLQERNEVVVFWPEGEKLKVSRELSFDQMKLKIRSKTNWFELTGELRVDPDLVLDMNRLLSLLGNTQSRFVPLGDGQFLALTEQLRKRLKDLELFTQTRGKSIHLHPLAALAMEGLTDQVAELQADAGWRSRIRQIHDGLAVTPPVPSAFRAVLRDYQVEGYTWLARLATLGFGACLADDMGLGKTIQVLAVLVERSAQGPSLVVAPTSVCMNWVEEAARFAPTLRTVVLGGNGRDRMVGELGAQDLLICSYGLLHQEAELLHAVEWNTIVLDEAQAIKNIKTKRAKAAMALNGAFKVITTGTPIENHLGEFWSLFQFINPGLLGSLRKFNERFAIPIEKNQDREVQGRLKRLIQPFLLRRTKSQVLQELPPRTEVTLRVEMGQEEAAFYEALRRRALERLALHDGPAPQKRIKILAEIMKLRQAACNPALIAPDSGIPSAKLELFEQVISELLASRHKVLVFSQFVGHLGLIRRLLDGQGIDYRYLDGATPAKVRRQEVNAFQAGQGDLFLISLKAGGLGLNLTAADYVIHMDPWWNPAVEDQASDRVHRIGQRRPVTVYRLVVAHTIEEKIVRLHREKRDLAGTLLAGTDVGGKISAEELLQLIREEA